MNKIQSKISSLFQNIYGNNTVIPQDFIVELNSTKQLLISETADKEWYKDVVVYSLYVDLFNRDFSGLEEKLPYLKNLGINCLWLLPILDSPMRDAGFDISDFKKIRPELTGGDTSGKVFEEFVNKAHKKGIKVIFDIAVNHTSDRHPWFREAKKSKKSPYHNYYIWNKDEKKYSDARIIFEGIETSNWTKYGDEYYFHRFFDFQPDLNYRNPEVLLEMSRNFLFWLRRGVDGFRVDAIPYLWKEDGTNCENLEGTHLIIKFFRAVIDYVKPSTLLLAEACQKPVEVVKYFGSGDECHAGYHFPLMPQIFKALAAKDNKPITDVLDTKVTPVIKGESQWFTFLRCHDELSLELVYVSEEDRKYIYDKYCKKPQWDFRNGQGISARLIELMDRNPEKIALIFSIMLTLPGTPVIYYGDEYGKINDENYYKEQIKLTGKNDTRFLVRGRIDWHQLETDMKSKNNLSFEIFSKLSKMLSVRNLTKAFGRGNLNWIDAIGENEKPLKEILAFTREYKKEKWLIIHNIGENNLNIKTNKFDLNNSINQINQKKILPENGFFEILPYEYLWIKI